MIAAMADASYSKSVFHIERYQESIAAKSHELLNRYDTLLEQETDEETRKKYRKRPTKRLRGCFSVRQPILWIKSCMNSVADEKTPMPDRMRKQLYK